MMAENQQGMLKLHSFFVFCPIVPVLSIPHILGNTLNLKQLETIWDFTENLCFKTNQDFFFCFLFVSLLLHGKWYGKEANPLEIPFWERLSVVKGSI